MNDPERLVDDNGHGYMTIDLRRLFLAEGCDPACHHCHDKIPVGDAFALVQSMPDSMVGDYMWRTESMVCWAHRDVDMRYSRISEEKERRELYYREHGKYPGCYVVNGAIRMTVEA